jgi:hypothetical protein
LLALFGSNGFLGGRSRLVGWRTGLTGCGQLALQIAHDAL